MRIQLYHTKPFKDLLENNRIKDNINDIIKIAFKKYESIDLDKLDLSKIEWKNNGESVYVIDHIEDDVTKYYWEYHDNYIKIRELNNGISNLESKRYETTYL